MLLRLRSFVSCSLVLQYSSSIRQGSAFSHFRTFPKTFRYFNFFWCLRLLPKAEISAFPFQSCFSKGLLKLLLWSFLANGLPSSPLFGLALVPPYILGIPVLRLFLVGPGHLQIRWFWSLRLGLSTVWSEYGPLRDFSRYSYRFPVHHYFPVI